MHNPPTVPGSQGSSMTLITLQTMPCGCVAAVYRAHPTVVDVALVEAKGPHCRFYRHQTGHVIKLGTPDSLDDPATEPTV